MSVLKRLLVLGLIACSVYWCARSFGGAQVSTGSKPDGLKLVVHHDDSGGITYVECTGEEVVEIDGKTYRLRPVWRPQGK